MTAIICVIRVIRGPNDSTVGCNSEETEKSPAEQFRL